MIKFILKLFEEPEKIEESTVDVEVGYPEKDKETLFNEAVKQVVKEKIYSKIKNEMIEMCYTEEEIEHTKAYAREREELKMKYPSQCEGYTEAMSALDKKYPKRVYNYGRGYDLYFNLRRFIDRLIEKELGEK